MTEVVVVGGTEMWASGLPQIIYITSILLETLGVGGDAINLVLELLVKGVGNLSANELDGGGFKGAGGVPGLDGTFSAGGFIHDL